jgi:two-component system OmpR family sensor kinase
VIRRYPSMYFRMAVHIGMALAAFVLLGALSVAMIASWQLQSYIATRHSSLAIEAAGVVAEGGQPALETWLRDETSRRNDVNIFVLDQESNDILGRSLPPQYREFVRDFVVGRDQTAIPNFQSVRLAPQIAGPDGQRYAFLVLPEGINVWGSAATALGVLAVAMLVIASVAWLIARAFIRPVRELQLAVRELASGDVNARVPESISTRKDELGDLAADFNAMAEQLSKLIENRHNLMRDMSHELRSPLARMQAALALETHRRQADGQSPIQLERVELEIENMNKVIGEMLRYSNADTATPPQRRLVRIDKLLTELAEIDEVEATNKKCTIALESDTNLTVIGDPELLRSGFENILRNAIRFAPEGTTIKLTASRKTDGVAVQIEDHGAGVPNHQLEEIFTPYFRIASEENNNQGTGLGLAIASRVFSSHSGTVWAENRPDGGLIVTTWLPSAQLD